MPWREDQQVLCPLERADIIEERPDFGQVIDYQTRRPCLSACVQSEGPPTLAVMTEQKPGVAPTSISTLTLLGALLNLAVALILFCFYGAFFGSLWIYQKSIGFGPGLLAFLGLGYLVLLPVLVFVPGLRGTRARLFFLRLAVLVIAGCVGFTLNRIETTSDDPSILYCRDMDCGITPPWYSKIIREEEVAFSGQALGRALGALSDTDIAETSPALKEVFESERQRLGGKESLNALLLSSDSDHVDYLFHRPPGTGPFPTLIFLHGFGGLLTSYVSLLADSPIGRRFAIVAPAIDILGYWWGGSGRDTVKGLLDRLPPEVDRSRLVLVGLSNGARGAAVIARDPELTDKFKGTVLLFGTSVRPTDAHWDQKISAPLLAIYGTRDNRFKPQNLIAGLDRMDALQFKSERVALDATHFVLFSDTKMVLDPLRDWLDRIIPLD